jgi:hypothetical protein
MTLQRILIGALLCAGLGACGGEKPAPAGSGGAPAPAAGSSAGAAESAADAEDQAVLDQVPTMSEAEAAAASEINEKNADATLAEIEKELGGGR